MPPPDDGNEYLPFIDLINVRQIEDDTYQSIALPFAPGSRVPDVKTPGAYKRSYGGHVYAQAAWAACQTVKPALLVYNVVGTFLLPGRITVPFDYRVHNIRDSRSFSTRIVNVTQGGSKDICFTALISFKKAESSPVDFQEKVALWDEMEAILEGKRPNDFPDCPAFDLPWYWKLSKETGHNEKFPGLDSTKVDMTKYNENRHPLDRRGLIFYRTTGQLPSDANLHLCAHLYASDRNSLFIVANIMGFEEVFTQMSSLVHTTIFHSPMTDLMFGPSESNVSPMDDTTVGGKWFAKEDWTTRSASGRTLLHGRLLAPDGTQVATILQDGLIRYNKNLDATPDEVTAIREIEKNWRRREKLQMIITEFCNLVLGVILTEVAGDSSASLKISKHLPNLVAERGSSLE